MRKDQRDAEGAPRGVGGENRVNRPPAPGGDPHPQKGGSRRKATATPLPFSQAGGDTRVPSPPPPPKWADTGPGAGRAWWMGAPQHDVGEQAGLTGLSPDAWATPSGARQGAAAGHVPPALRLKTGDVSRAPRAGPEGM